MLTSSMQAALGEEKPPARPDRLAWVDVDSPPRMVEVRDPVDPDNVLGWYAALDDERLTDQMVTKLRAVCDIVDGSGCEADDCPHGYEVRGRTVPAGIGWVLAGDADERNEWRHVALVQATLGDDKPRVIAVCEGCSPSGRYQGLWPAP